MLIVQKFGGSSVADGALVQRAARRTTELIRQGHRVVTVVSAQGHTTDQLLALAQSVAPEPSFRESDSLLAAGEQISAALMAMALEDLGTPAISLTGWQAGLQTDAVHGNAHILGLTNDRIHRELAKGKAVVVAGFQGLCAGNDVTTLGRGGSDTTAVALAAFLKADQCRIYTDVDGVYDRDPRKHPEALRYDRLDYDTMLAMARSGAQVLHDRCVELAKKYGVSIRVLSSFRDGPGTLVEGV
jgi:aspartate kinase